MGRLIRRLTGLSLVLSLGSLAAIACGGGGSSGGGNGDPKPKPEPPKADLNVNVIFPDPASTTETASVHIWAVAGKGEAGLPSCPSLLGGALDPYDQSLERRADFARGPFDLPGKASGVLLGPALVYVEAVGFDGVVALAGCEPTDVQQPEVSVEVTLTKAKIFDCKDPATEEGARCDDGKQCTTGERCDAGQCKGGVQRDCSYLSDACNVGNCDETNGCTQQPLPDLTPCDDNLNCTDGDVCTAGVCGGLQRDCSKEVTSDCKIATACSETLGCQFANAPYGTTCDDEKYCTVNDACNSSGTCLGGSARDCSSVADQCNNASCDELTDTCKPTPKSTSFSCNDNLACTTLDHCDGLGGCTGTGKNCSTLNDQCNIGICSEPSGNCIKSPKTDGTVCDDANPITINDKCTAGVCAGT